MPVKKSKLSELKKNIPFKWRIQTITDHNALCVAYVDARDVQNILDDVVGPENWQSEFLLIDDKLFCRLGIYVDYEDDKICPNWVWKCDTGTESNTEKEKGQVSDSMKRAAVNFGVGRFLYDMSIQKIKVKKHTNGKIYPCDNDGNILWDGDTLTEYINSKISNKSNQHKVNTEKYEKPAEQPTYTIPIKHSWSPATTDKASKIEKDGLKGSTLLIKYLPQYNEKNETKYKSIQELNTDDKLNSLITFVENIPPNGLI